MVSSVDIIDFENLILSEVLIAVYHRNSELFHNPTGCNNKF